MKICMFVKNPISVDPRVKREALHLKNAGHDVNVIGIPSKGMPRKEVWEGVKFYRIHHLGYNRGAVRKLLKLIFGLNGSYKKDVSDKRFKKTNLSSVSKKNRQNHSNFRRLLHFWIKELRISATWVTKGLMLNADVYHAHDLDTALYALLCSSILRKKFVYDSHELWLEWRGIKKDTFSQKLWGRIEHRTTKSTDLVVTVSNGLAEALKNKYKIPRPLVVCNCAPLKPLKRSEILRNVIGGDESRPIVLYQGGLVSGKGLEELIRAASEVPNADIVLIGKEKPYKEKLKQLATNLKAYNVHFVEWIPTEQLWHYTSSANIGIVLTQPVCLSYVYAQENKLFEYMVAGIPIVASSTESHRYLADETGVLELVDPYDPHDIALAINRLLESPEKMKEIGANARKWAEQKYNTSKEMEKLLLAYETLCPKIQLTN